jgi:prepilin-type N-terminal cleavage/methylation domain-containing protein
MVRTARTALKMTFTTNNIGAPQRLQAPPCASSARRNSARRKGVRHGFTLMELVLVLAILVAIGAVAWPAIGRAYESSKLKAVGDKVMSALGRARVQAMTTGQTQIFRFQPSSGAYVTEVLPDDPTAADAGTTSTTSTSSTSAGSNCQLPEGYIFAAGDRVLDLRASVAESAITSTNFDTSAPPILFYADGTSSEAQITIANQNNRNITVSLRGLTGTAHMGPVTAGPEVGAQGQTGVSTK